LMLMLMLHFNLRNLRNFRNLAFALNL